MKSREIMGAVARMSKTLKYSAAAAAAGVLQAGPALAAWDMNLRVGVTELSRDIYGLHMLIMWVCVAIAVAVFGVMVYSIVRFRRSAHPEPATFSHNTKAEIIWTVIPVFILVAMAIPAAETLVRIEDTRGSELSIKVTGYQWKWHYEYLDQGVSFFSTLDETSNAARQPNSGIEPGSVENYLLEVDNPLVVPVDTKVRILLTAADVLHAWWVPDFGMKKDAIPGFVNELWFNADVPGIYRGQCAELCGRDHGFMPVVVEVRSKEDYAAWLKEKQDAAAPPAAAAAGAPANNLVIDGAIASVAKAE
jgi:cytochrome c oxidase subunit II